MDKDSPGAPETTTCELDPVTWDALVSAMQRHGVAAEVVAKVCHDALEEINTTPVAERDRRLAEADAYFARRQAGLL
ncbi:hypothetical protein [Phaeacidiphilus oryzae]|jgi:hypothetical protein|uniref:hypothetical protein n=1 Tax=Phaeacidiphilus oryzae TaxID=348818 RepID=UPI0005661BF3|nr:hypothetical protein [Phaeacidiphilus oryzae]